MLELSAGLEALSWAKAARVSGNAGGVAGVFVGTQDACCMYVCMYVNRN